MDSKLEDCIRTRVPNLNNSKINEVLKTLQELGVNDLDDLELVTEEDLKSTLTVIQARQLLSKFAGKRNTETGEFAIEKLRHDLEIMKLKDQREEQIRKHAIEMKKLQKNEDDDIQSRAQSSATKEDLQRTAGLGGSFGACGAAVGLGVDGPPGAFIGAGNGSVIGGGAGLRVSRKTKAVAGVDGTDVELEGEVRRVEVGMCYLCKQSLRIGKINGPLVCTKCKTGCHRTFISFGACGAAVGLVVGGPLGAAIGAGIGSVFGGGAAGARSIEPNKSGTYKEKSRRRPILS